MATEPNSYHFVYALGRPPSTGPTFNVPSGVDVDELGNIWVADTQNRLIREFSSAYSEIPLPFGQNFGLTMDIAVDSSGYIYVIDVGADISRLTVFAPAANNYLFQWSHTWSDGLTSGVSVAVDNSGTVYALTNDQVYKPDSSSPDTPLVDGLNGAHGIAVDDAGNIYVADTGNMRIQKFDSSGLLIDSFTLGFYPVGIDVDSSGNMFVSDYTNNRVVKLSSAGIELSSFGAFGTGDGQFDGPYGLALDNIGNVYVADSNNNRIQKFSPGPELAVPEYDLGCLAALGACFVGFAVFKKRGSLLHLKRRI